MSQKIVQINFKLNVPAKDYEQACLSAAQPLADTPGLRWKVWLLNEAGREAGGLYLFDDEASAQAYLVGPIATGLKNSPALSDLSVKVFDVMEDLTAITRGPVREGIRV